MTDLIARLRDVVGDDDWCYTAAPSTARGRPTPASCRSRPSSSTRCSATDTQRPDVSVGAAATPGDITEEDLRRDGNVGSSASRSGSGGRGATGSDNLMEDAAVGEDTWQAGKPEATRAVLEAVALGDDFPELLTLPAYGRLD